MTHPVQASVRPSGSGNYAMPRRGNRVTLDVTFVCSALAIGPLFINDWIGALAPVLFILFGAGVAVMPPRISMKSITRLGFAFVIPALAFASTFWSQYPSLTLRFSVQVILTYALAIVILNKISAEKFLKILFLTFAFATVMSLVFGRMRVDGVPIGIFGSKNAYAAALAAGLLCSCAIVIHRRIALLWRLAGAGMIGICFIGMVAAQSAGTLLTVFPAILICIGLSSVAIFSRRQRGAAFVILALFAVYVAINFYMFEDVIFSSVLNAVGKDTTLTGRTVLWSVATDYIHRNPIFGMGYKAFWVQGFAPAEMLWAEFEIKGKYGFNFHNTYYEFSVYLGLIGGAIAFLILTGGLLVSIYANFVQPSVPQAFMAAIMAFLYLKSFGEVGVLTEFNPWTVIFLATWIFSLRTLQDARSRQRRPSQRPARLSPLMP